MMAMGRGAVCLCLFGTLQDMAPYFEPLGIFKNTYSIGVLALFLRTLERMTNEKEPEIGISTKG